MGLSAVSGQLEISLPSRFHRPASLYFKADL